MGEGVSLAFDLDPFPSAERLHEGVNGLVVRFRTLPVGRCLTTFPNLVAAAGVMLVGPRSRCWRTVATGAFGPPICCSAVVRTLLDIGIPR